MAYKDDLPTPGSDALAILALGIAFVVVFFAAIAACEEIDARDCPAGTHYSTYDSAGRLVCRDGEIVR